jgi:hypothetical protein
LGEWDACSISSDQTERSPARRGFELKAIIRDDCLWEIEGKVSHVSADPIEMVLKRKHDVLKR